jgi:Tfp pilus assembly protein PilX
MSAAHLPALSQRDRTVLLFGVVVIISMLVAFRGLPALRQWKTEIRASAAELDHELGRANASVAALPAARDTLAVRNYRYNAISPALLPGGSALSAGSALTELVSDAALASNVRLGSTEVSVRSDTASLFVRVAVSASATGDVRGLAGFLHSLERGPRLLAVRRISITQPEVGADANQPEALRVELLVEGLARVQRERARR